MKIRAPLSGVIVALDTIPDPVFAAKMVGDGVSIDPTSCEVCAPFAGRISQLHASHHALAITADNGVEVLIHIGLDTVFLQGRGFVPLVAKGDRVDCAQPLLRFDPEIVGREARSLMTQVVVTTADRVQSIRAATGLARAGETVLLQVNLREAVSEVSSGSASVEGELISLPNPLGLHARPAAVLATAARRFTADIQVLKGDTVADAKAVMALMGLATKKGDRVRVVASGPDAEEAVQTLTQLLTKGSGEPLGESAPVLHLSEPEVAQPEPLPGEVQGRPAAPGLALGRVHHLRRNEPEVPQVGGPEDEERSTFNRAQRQGRAQLHKLLDTLDDAERKQIIQVQLVLLDDPSFTDAVDTGLAAGKSAGYAWLQAYRAQAERLESLDSALLKERAADVRDLGRRLLSLMGGASAPLAEIPKGSVVFAEEVSPTEVLGFTSDRVVALCTRGGSATSHVAILARNLGIPSVCGLDPEALAAPDGARVAVDGGRGVIRIDPDADAMALLEERIARDAAARAKERVNALAPARTKDGHRVEVAANIAGIADAREAIATGAEGVGLLRSEFMFIGQQKAPTEDEQAAVYESVAELLGADRPFVVRTLDVGGDKPLAFLPLPKEANPFLGIRGIRVSLQYPELFETQVRAIIRAARFGNLHVMFPMVEGLEDFRAAKRIFMKALGASPYPVRIGVMVEVPSAAVMAESLAKEADFLSIGTNDLTQYTLAMDRGHAQLAERADALHPAVLRLIATTVEGGHKHDRWVGVCGGIASDPAAVPVLVGLGIDELSVSVPAIPSVKATLARWTRTECVALAKEALNLATAAEVRELLETKQLAPVVTARRETVANAASVEG